MATPPDERAPPDAPAHAQEPPRSEALEAELAALESILPAGSPTIAPAAAPSTAPPTTIDTPVVRGPQPPVGLTPGDQACQQ